MGIVQRGGAAGHFPKNRKGCDKRKSGAGERSKRAVLLGGAEKWAADEWWEVSDQVAIGRKGIFSHFHGKNEMMVAGQSDLIEPVNRQPSTIYRQPSTVKK